MAIDYWPEQDGIIVKGLVCAFCYADAAIAANRIVAWGANSAVGRISVKSSAAVGDGIGIALKASTATGDIIPVAFSGIVKVVTDETLSIGNYVINKSSLYVVGIGASNNLNFDSGASTTLGCLMQTGADEQDEILMLLGGSGVGIGTT